MDHQTKKDEIEMIEVVIIEEYAKSDKPVPKRHKYEIRVDKDNYRVDTAVLTGREILAVAGKKPEEYDLYQHVRGGQTKSIKADEKVDLTEPGIERFTTLKRANTEG